MLVITLNAAEIKCHVHQSTAAHHEPIWSWFVVIWSWFGHDLVMIWSWFGHGPPLPTTEGQPSQRRLTAAAPPTYPVSTAATTVTHWQISHGSFWPKILALCWGFFSALHMLTGNNTKVSPAGWSVHWLHEENVGLNSKFQTLTSQPRLKQPQHVPVILKLCESNKLVQAMACNKKRGFSGRNRKPTWLPKNWSSQSPPATE